MTVYTTPTTSLDAIQGGQVNAANTFDNTTITQIQNAGFTVYPLQLNWAGLSLLDRDGKMSGPLGKVRYARRSTWRSTGPPCSRT